LADVSGVSYHSAGDLVSAGYQGYAGWSDLEALYDFRATGGSGKKTQPQGFQPAPTLAPTPAPSFEQKLEQSQQAVAPAISTLEKGIDPLKQKYNDIIASLNTSQGVAVGKAEKATAASFGKRGIPLTSGIYDQALQEATLPIISEFQSIIANTSLTSQQAENQIYQAVSNLQAQSGMSAFEAANVAENLIRQLNEQREQFNISTAQQASQFDKTFGLQQQQFGLQQQLANQPQTSFQNIGGNLKLVNSQTGQVIADLGKSGTGGAGGLSATQKQELAQQVLDAASQGRTHADIQKQFGAQLGTDKVTDLYNASSIYGEHGTAQSIDYAEQLKQQKAKQGLETFGQEEEVPWYKKAAQFFGVF